ncbi:patatin-like phospholipase family protein [Ekhidna sp. To15]|uniref:patatin-like phospholipase family protein n=1 Tax=Ekhidna sp. To15 TaxID=3395267 RepID=UPI003F5220CE
MKENKKIGLALSGGGYRAAAYHIGTLRKLRDMELLDSIDVISSNSGGSIIAATYCIHVDNYDGFEKIMLRGLKKSMISRLLISWRFTPIFLIILSIPTLLWIFIGGFWAMVSLPVIAILIGFFQFNLLPFSKGNERNYRKIFHGKTTLSDLPDSPQLVINSTNVETGRPFTFATDKMSDSTYAYPDDGTKGINFVHKKFPIARAVAASSCVPFAFSPVTISKEYFQDRDDFKRIKPRLVDGGIYDNQGIHKLAFGLSSYSCDVIIVSDAGNQMPFKNTYRNVLALLIRISDVFMNRIKNQQMIDLLFDSIESKDREIAYHSLGWDFSRSIDEFIRAMKNSQILAHVWQSHGITSQEIEDNQWDEIKRKVLKSVDYSSVITDANTQEQEKLARSVGTNLTPLSDVKIEALINHASVMTELQIKLYCPTLLK